MYILLSLFGYIRRLENIIELFHLYFYRHNQKQQKPLASAVEKIMMLMLDVSNAYLSIIIAHGYFY
jgi:hypothetical protein